MQRAGLAVLAVCAVAADSTAAFQGSAGSAWRPGTARARCHAVTPLAMQLQPRAVPDSVRHVARSAPLVCPTRFSLRRCARAHAASWQAHPAAAAGATSVGAAHIRRYVEGCSVCVARGGACAPYQGRPERFDPGAGRLRPKPETRNPKPETRNPKPETRNLKPETPGYVARCCDD